MSRLQNLGCVLWGIACGVSAAGAQALPTPSAPAVARVNASSASVPATGSLLITIKELDATTAADATLLTEPTDVVGASTTPPTVTFDRPLALPTTGSQRNWVLPFRVAGMPAGAELTRYFSFKLGTADWTLGYQLSSPAAVVTSWGLKPTPVQVRAIAPDEPLPLSVTIVGPLPVTGIRVAPVVLVEQGSKRTLAASQLTLCQTPAPCKGEPFNLEGNGSHEVWLAPRSNKDGKAVSTLSPGKYDGAVTLSSSDKPGGESVNVTVHVTSWCWQVTGFVLIVIGVGAAWFFTTFLRHRLGRDQMRLTAMVLRGSVDKIARTLGALKPAVNAPEIEARLDKLEVALSDQSLQSQGLPPPSPLPWSGTNALTNADTFKKHIEAQMSWINALQAIVNDGIVRLVKRRQGFEALAAVLTALQFTSFDNALQALDQLAISPAAPDATALSALIDRQLDAFEAAIAPPAAPGARGVGAAQRARARSPEETLRMRIALDSLLAWGFIGAVTSLAGGYILVLSNTGFGTALDLAGCFLWGVGLPTGTLLASTTTSSIATTFNVTR